MTLRRKILVGYGIALALTAVVLVWSLAGLIELSGASDGRSVAARSVAAAVALRVASAVAAKRSPVRTIPPYSRPETVQRMGTS